MEEAVIRIGIDSGNSNKTLGEIRQEIQGIETASEKVGDNLSEGVNRVTNSTKSLKAQLRQMKVELANLPEGSAEFNQMAQEAGELEDRIGDVSARVRSLASDTKRLDGLMGAGQAIAGGFQAAQGAMALFGSNSAAVEKAVQNVIAVQGVMNGVTSVANSLNKDTIAGQYLRIGLSKIGLALTREEAVATNTQTVGMVALSAATAVYNTVVGTSTGLMKVFRIALLSTGVGALIVGLGLLIANFSKVQKWVGSIIDGFKALGDAIMAVAEFFGFVEKGTVANMQAERKQQAERRQASAELGKQHAERLNQIKKEFDETIKASKSKIDSLKLEKATLEANGKNSAAVNLQILEEQLAQTKAILYANDQKLKSWIQYYAGQAALRGQSHEEYINQMKDQGTDLYRLQEAANELIKQNETAVRYAELEITKFKREESEKREGIAKTAADKQKAIDEKRAGIAKAAADKQKEIDEKLAADKLAADQKSIEDQAKIEKEISDRKIEEKNNYIAEVEKLETDYYDSLLTDQQREENAVREKYFNLIEQAKQYGEDYSLLLIAQDAELAIITDEFSKKAAEKQIEDNLKRIELQKEYAENIIAGATAVVNIIDSINTIANKKEIDRIKKKQEAGEQLSKKEENKLKRDIAMQKAFAIAKIAIDTASALTSAIAGATASAAAAGPAAVAFTPVFIATQIATVLAAVGSALAIINAPTPAIGGGGGAGGGVGDSTEDTPDPTPPDTELFKTGQSILNQPPMKVYVLEQDISDTQSNVAQIKQQATFG
jgi:phosphopantetheine adenylyltransferase